MVTAGLRPCLRVGLLLVLGCAHIAAAAAEEHEADALVRESRAVSHFKGLYDFLQQRDATVFCKYLRRAEVEDVLVSLQAFTIFAPNDMAFAALPASLLKKIESDKRFLRTFVLHHIAGDAVSSRSLKGELEITTLSGDNLLVKVYDNGRTISIAGGNIIQGDTNFENVVLHIVDRVLYPFAESVLPQTIQSKYGYFYKLLQSAGLVQVLNSDLYTVFIPTQDAINSLPADTSKAILSDSTLLKRVLSHHIVPGLQFSGVFKDGATLTPLDGEVMRVTTQAGQIFIDGVPFVNYDEGATNGVIHLVNRVLMPKSVIEDCGCFASKDDVSLIGQKLTIQGPTLVGQQLPGITQQHVLLPGTVSTVSGLTTRVISPGGVVSLQQPFGIFSTGKVPLPGAPGFLGATPLVSGKPGLPAFGGRKPSPPTAPQGAASPSSASAGERLGVIPKVDHTVFPPLHVLKLPYLEAGSLKKPKQTLLFGTSFTLEGASPEEDVAPKASKGVSPAGPTPAKLFPDDLLKPKRPPGSQIGEGPPCDEYPFYHLIRQALPPTHPLRLAETPQTTGRQPSAKGQTVLSTPIGGPTLPVSLLVPGRTGGVAPISLKTQGQPFGLRKPTYQSPSPGLAPHLPGQNVLGPRTQPGTQQNRDVE